MDTNIYAKRIADFYGKVDGAIQSVANLDGDVPQEVFVIEECSELIKELTKERRGKGDKNNVIVDDADIHTLMIGASGVGKTANFLYPNIEYCCVAGMSFVTTDSKGDLYRNIATIAENITVTKYP